MCPTELYHLACILLQVEVLVNPIVALAHGCVDSSLLIILRQPCKFLPLAVNIDFECHLFDAVAGLALYVEFLCQSALVCDSVCRMLVNPVE